MGKPSTRIAERILNESKLPRYTDPRFIARALNFRLALGEEATSEDTIVYRHTSDARELGLRIHIELARAYLLRNALEGNPAAIGAELAVPVDDLVAVGVLGVMHRQPHAPVSLIRRRFLRRIQGEL